MKKLLLLFILTGSVACSSVKTGFDYDREADFAKYKTYSFSEASDDLGVGELDRDRILKAVEKELTAKGFAKSDDPDAIVDLHLKTKQKQDATATTMGTGPWGYGYGGGFSTTSINYNDYTEGTLFISLVDAASNEIFWQGTGTKVLEERAKMEKKEAGINYTIEQIMKNYPPK